MTDHKAEHVAVLRDMRADPDNSGIPESAAALDAAIAALTAAPAASDPTINSDGIDSRLIGAASEGEDGAVAWRIYWSCAAPGYYELTGSQSRVADVRTLEAPPPIEPLYTRPAAQVAATPKHDEGREALELLAKYHDEQSEGAPDQWGNKPVKPNLTLEAWHRQQAAVIRALATQPAPRPVVGADWVQREEVLAILREVLGVDGSMYQRIRALATQPAARRVTDGDAWRWVSERAWFVDAAAHAFDLRFGPGDFSTEPRNADADDVREAIFAAMREEAGPEAEDSRESFAQPAEGVSGG